MKIMKQITRRGFITNTALAGIGTLGAANLLNSCTTENTGTGTIKETGHHEYNNYYSGRHLDRIAFPIGGLGAGMFCLEGTGGISHMSIHNHPEVFNEPCMFAAISVKGFEKRNKSSGRAGP